MKFTFQQLTEDDLETMSVWLTRPHLQKWWREEEISLNSLRKKYLPRIKSPDAAHPYLAYLPAGPVGYIQYYSVSNGRKDWWPEKPGPGLIGIDLFIADVENLNKGMGTELLSQFINWLQEKEKFRKIWIDPSPENERAIRCYEKAGFKKRGLITTPAGKAMMMEYDTRLN
ncbi:GNAT family N-acetyltransferase [soil metagenome]